MPELNADIVVLGSGIAGYAAAMAAAETHSVMLIDKTATPGGATTHTNVGTLCGLYYINEQTKPIPHPFCLDFINALKAHDQNAKLLSLPNNLHVLSYEWSNLQKLISDQLSKTKSIQTLFGHEVTDIETENRSIKSVIVKGSDGIKKILCSAVIDCTGTGFTAQLLNHPMLTESSYQSAAQVIRLTNVNATTEYALNLSIRKTILKNQAQYNWPVSYTMTSIVPGSIRQNQVDLKIPLSGKVTDAEKQSTDLQKEISQYLPALLKALQEVESLANATLDTIFPVPGIRIQQRPEGQYILTENDVLNGTQFDDAIAISTWPIEEWDYAGKVIMQYFRQNNAYTIPARSLRSPLYDNLFFAGKGISADTKAIASARVTGTCLQTGYAAGKLATCSTSDEEQTIINKIQRAWKE